MVVLMLLWLEANQNQSIDCQVAVPSWSRMQRQCLCGTGQLIQQHCVIMNTCYVKSK